MIPDNFKQAWDSQSSRVRLTVDLQQLDVETRDFQQRFTKLLFWRDLREIGIAVLLIPVWLFLGTKLRLPWTWYLMVPALLWVSGYMLLDRMRTKPRSSEAEESLCGRLERLLGQIEQQIRFLGSIHLWCLLPMAVPMLAFVIDVTLKKGAPGWGTALFFSMMVLFLGGVLYLVYHLNQIAIRTELIPRRDMLRTQLRSLREESAGDES